MFKELEDDIPGFKKPNHGDLTGWAKQGISVILLSTLISFLKTIFLINY
jgi:uracil-DNA glycosylase